MTLGSCRNGWLAGSGSISKTSRAAAPTCPDCKQEARGYQPADIVDELLSRFMDARAMILFPVDDARGNAEAMLKLKELGLKISW